ncbi:CHAT domain-containing protein [Leptolyngbya sp. GGD]|uniref:CHAT domain-containing protein n=1 Tax=Leptolyngbya sp. GGD TaxID=2997907 RepID=UPI00227B8E59|nr:CHAT domain-containing tetratricopeptide repeat protein [Leptolyngbya sp. GGD]MCY6493888.1 CHAT domain-containing protein [Leptolyngbya sp. GGD]
MLLCTLIQEFRGDRRSLDLEIAIAGYEIASSILTRSRFPLQWAEVQANMATVYCERTSGDLSENLNTAIELYKVAIEVFKTVSPLLSRLPQVSALTHLGIAYIENPNGNLDDNTTLAIQCYEDALELCDRETEPDEWALLQCALGNAYCVGNRTNSSKSLDRAICYYHSALEIHTRDRYPAEWANIQYNLGNAHCLKIQITETRQIDEAVTAFNNALQIYSRESYSERWAAIQNSLGNIYSAINELELAEKFYWSALEIIQPSSHSIECFKFARNLGNMEFKAQRWLDAIKAYKIALSAIEAGRIWGLTVERRREILEGAIQVYADLVESYIEVEQVIPALECAEQSRTRGLVELILNREAQNHLPPKVAQEFQALQREIKTLEQRLLAKATQEPTLSQHQLRSLKQKALEIQQKHFPQGTDFQFKQLRSMLDQHTSVIIWYATSSKLITFIITPGATEPKIQVSTEQSIQRLRVWTQQYLTDSNQNQNEWFDSLDDCMEELADILCFDKLLAEIPENYERLIFIPHRGLHLFPLHAMATKVHPCLFERFPQGVFYAPSCQLLRLSHMRERSDFSNIIAIENPDGVGVTGNLDHASAEVEAITSSFKSAQILKQKQATKATFNEQDFDSIHCLHFACHGYFDPEHPQRSALFLADSPLRLEDIFKLDLKHCRLVTLSACETGKIDASTPIDEYIGLPSAFLYAGSASVVSSLWQVDDLLTALLMIRFYGNLKNSGSVAIALNQAQRWLREVTKSELQTWLVEQSFYKKSPTMRVRLAQRLYNCSDESQPFRQPRYWAGFCAIGQ